MASKTVKTLCAVGLMISPPVLTTAWLSVNRAGWAPQADYLMLGLVLAIGVCGVLMLPAAPWARAVMAVTYLLGMGLIVVVWALSFVCVAFGGCP